MDILLTCLGVAVVSAILMRLHFRNAPDVRSALIGPPVFAVIGALIGISAGMMWLWVGAEGGGGWEGRIHLEQGVANVVVGTAVGGVMGIGALAIGTRYPRTRVVVVVLTLMLLTTSMGAPIGWLYGDLRRHRMADDPATEAVRSTQNGMMWGSAIGCAVGLSIGLLEAVFGKQRPKVVAIPDPVNDRI